MMHNIYLFIVSVTAEEWRVIARRAGFSGNEKNIASSTADTRSEGCKAELAKAYTTVNG